MKYGNWLRLGVVLAMVVASAAARADERPEEGEKHLRFTPLVAPLVKSLAFDRDGGHILVSSSAQALKPGKYWIGVGCEPPGEALRAQLGVEQGLVVTQVSQGQPAEKAGIQKHDLLLEFGEKKLGQVQELIDAIDAAQGKETTVLLMRRGKEIKIDVTPIERPKSARQASGQYDEALDRLLPPHLDGEALKKKLQSGDDADRAWDRAFQLWNPEGGVIRDGSRLWRFGPGFVSPDVNLPEGVTLYVQKEGDKPAKIIVKRGGKSWNVTEKSLDELPDEFRAPVKRFLGRAPTVYALPRPPATGTPPAVESKPPAPPRAQLRLRDLRLNEGMQQQMDEMLKQLKQIREQMDRDGALDRMRRELDSLRREVDQLREKRDGKE
jgi:membrane-associated protease RseP (regulator of RpoE activity)